MDLSGIRSHAQRFQRFVESFNHEFIKSSSAASAATHRCEAERGMILKIHRKFPTIALLFSFNLIALIMQNLCFVDNWNNS